MLETHATRGVMTEKRKRYNICIHHDSIIVEFYELSIKKHRLPQS